jgi:uncharacterized protein YggU (UPF0235/DUF167 family)
VAKSDLIDIVVLFRTETANAVLVNDLKKLVWLPKSQIEIVKSKTDKTCTVTLPEWLAIEKGLV